MRVKPAHFTHLRGALLADFSCGERIGNVIEYRTKLRSDLLKDLQQGFAVEPSEGNPEPAEQSIEILPFEYPVDRDCCFETITDGSFSKRFLESGHSAAFDGDAVYSKAIDGGL